jgi:enolase-phosphatase E1
MLQNIVIDIEGTSSATYYVTGHLYPYSADRLACLIQRHESSPAVSHAVDQVRELIGEPVAALDRATAVLLDRQASDQKVTPLKTLQGMIWEQGFANGDLTAYFYPDAVPALRAWKTAGRTIYIFSSRSSSARRAWFGPSPEGDLRSLISGYFDTENAGPKREASSYQRIAASTRTDPAQIVFASDAAAELDAAREAGWHTVGVRHPGERNYDSGVGGHLEVSSLANLDFSGDRPTAIP